MIYVISYLPPLSAGVVDGHVFIRLEEKRYPLREIDRLLSGMKADDTVIMLSDTEPSIPMYFIRKLENLYNSDQKILTMAITDDDIDIASGNIDLMFRKDSIIFQRECMRNGLRDISHTSSYYECMRKIVTLCGSNIIYVPEYRVNLGKYADPEGTDVKWLAPDTAVIKAKLNLGIGDMVYAKAMFDNVRHKFSKIYVSLNDDVLNFYREGDATYKAFCLSFMRILFDEFPYVITDDQTYPPMSTHTGWLYSNILPIKPNLRRYLCEGKLPSGLEPDNYIVITTKVRGLITRRYKELIGARFWSIIQQLSKKYKIVVLGERQIGVNREYTINKNFIFGIYDEIIKNIPPENRLDLTIPELGGRTPPSIPQIKQDCFIMSQAKHVISLGIGGNTCLSTAVSHSTLCLRDPEPVNDYLYDDKGFKNPNVFSTTNIAKFNNRIKLIAEGEKMPNIYKVNMYLGIGSLIYTKAILDNARGRYDRIYVAPWQFLLNQIHPKDESWKKFTDDLIKLFFSEPPYIITDTQDYPHKDTFEIMNDGFIPMVPHLSKYLCAGEIPEILKNTEYIVMSTKVRWFYRSFYQEAILAGLWDTIAELSNKYKIVILGEREVGENAEYRKYKDHVYSLYYDMITNIPKENIIDLSMPEWGKSAPSLERLQKDCMIMHKAKHSITLGIGGNFCMSTAVADTIGLADPKDPDQLSRTLYPGDKFYPRVWITRNIPHFIEKLKTL